ncbi:MAG: orotidine-5'-phosphate decarboxylase [Candidatus Woesearchaeota archaeon]
MKLHNSLTLSKLSSYEKKARNMICLPLDGINSISELRSRVKELSPYVGLFKIGKESFTKFGPSIIDIVHKFNSKVFLDLKYHDIPATVKGAVSAACLLGVKIVNVHASGGSEMLKAAVSGLKNKTTKLIAVTVLTSLDDNSLHEIGIDEDVNNHVLRLANLTAECGLHGIVCSAKDLNFIKKKLPKNFMYVTPGISGIDNNVGNDQKRVMRADEAVISGASILVIGRAITGYNTKKERCIAARNILTKIANVLFERDKKKK